VHDLRKVADGPQQSECFSFGFHKQPITSLDWCPFEDSMIAVSSADDRCASPFFSFSFLLFRPPISPSLLQD
jgi:hypothetical protein